IKYVERSDGSIVDGYYVQSIQEAANMIFFALKERRMALEKWGQASFEAVAFYRHQLEGQSYELWLCELHWKSKQVATLNYPTWSSTYLHKDSVDTSQCYTDKHDLNNLEDNSEHTGPHPKHARTPNNTTTVCAPYAKCAPNSLSP
ncbi:hypothetical protein BDQ17DRAFT_1242898, partial [Cyathus striatus]